MIAPTGQSTTVRWRLSHGLPLTEALRIGEAMHSAAIGSAKRVFGENSIPWVLSGHDLPYGAEHEHAFYLPEDADLDGWIDDVVIHADAGLCQATVSALQSFTPRVSCECLDMWAGDGRSSRAGGCCWARRGDGYP